MSRNLEMVEAAFSGRTMFLFFFFGSRRNRFLKQAHPSGFVWNLSVRGTWSKHILVVGTLRLDQTEINMCTRWLGSGYLLCGAWMLITQFVGCWVLSKNFCAGWLNICYLETLVHMWAWLPPTTRLLGIACDRSAAWHDSINITSLFFFVKPGSACVLIM